MIQLITHNGRPRSEGGLMLGYMFERPDGSKGVWPPSLIPAATPASATRKSVLDELNVEPVSAGIRVVRSIWGYVRCPVCANFLGSGHDPVPLGESRCRDCGELLNVRGY